MFGTLSRSWEVTKVSFQVIKKDKEMLWFPLLAGIFSIAFMAIMLFPTIITNMINSTAGTSFNLLDYIVLFITYAGTSFIATYFNVCVVFTAKTRFEGENATFSDSLKFAWSRKGLILSWSILAATVGLILRAIESIADRIGGIGEVVINIITSLVGMAWSVITVFVIPGMVYKGLKPFEAIKYSSEMLKKTWGEQLIKYMGLSLIQFMFILLGILVFAFGLGPVGSLGITATILFSVIIGVYIVGVILVFNVANSVYNTALFEYAEYGKVPASFKQDLLGNAFRKRRGRI